MRDRWIILAGLLVFLALMTYPVWFNLLWGRVRYTPEVVVTTRGVPGKDQCVMPSDYMRARHMDLLNQWRDEAVREGSRVFVAADGRKFNKSLSHTCLDCHSNKSDFCDRCHNYLAVNPYCWQCHLDPNEAVPHEF